MSSSVLVALSRSSFSSSRSRIVRNSRVFFSSFSSNTRTMATAAPTGVPVDISDPVQLQATLEGFNMQANKELLEANGDPRAVLEWAGNNLGGYDKLAMSTSFGIQSAVLLHIATSVCPNIPVVWVDTGYLPKETYLYAEALNEALDLNLKIISNLEWTPARMEAVHGKLWESDRAEAHKLYGTLRKVQPMNHGLSSLEPTPVALLSGLRKVQTKSRAGMQLVEFQAGRFKILPMLNMTDDDVNDYMDRHDLPSHPLSLKGYHTVGDWHSSRAVKEGEDPRDTRFGGKFQECGLHADDTGATTLQVEPEEVVPLNPAMSLLRGVDINPETGHAVVMVKKLMEDGSYCRKCQDVQGKLEKDNVLPWVSKTFVADVQNSKSDGALLAKEFDVDKAPFFIVKNPDEDWSLVYSYLQLRKRLKKAAKEIEKTKPPVVAETKIENDDTRVVYLESTVEELSRQLAEAHQYLEDSTAFLVSNFMDTSDSSNLFNFGPGDEAKREMLTKLSEYSRRQ